MLESSVMLIPPELGAWYGEDGGPWDTKRRCTLPLILTVQKTAFPILLIFLSIPK